jgi:putative flippase GtrA
VRRLFTFAFAGGMGFVADAVVLQVLAEGLGLQVHFARVLSFLAAVTVTWQINRHFTFRREPANQRDGLFVEWAKYLASSLFGGAFNYGAFSLAIALSPYVRDHLYIGVAIGSLAGMLVNYGLYSRFVFGTKR